MTRVFIDTSVLVYLFDSREKVKRRRAAQVLREVTRPVVSTQVLGEFYVTVTRQFATAMSPMDARAAIDRMRQWQVVPVDADTVVAALDLTSRFAMSYWDAQVAASAAGAGCHLLLTEDLTGPDEVLGVRRENPFA